MSTKIPPVVTTAILLGVTAVLNHILLNVGQFHLPELYVPIAISILTMFIKMVAEKMPATTTTPLASPRGLDGEVVTPVRDGYWKRVFVG